MNALDKAFIKAYANGTRGAHAPAVLEDHPTGGDQATAALHNRAATEVARLSPLVEVSAADGVWYRIEQPVAKEMPIPAPHFAPRASRPSHAPPDAVQAIVQNNLSAAELLDTWPTLHERETAWAPDEAPSPQMRADGPHVRSERRETTPSREQIKPVVLNADELAAFIQGAATSVICHGWDSSVAAGAVSDSLCQCWVSTEEIAAASVIELTWVTAAPKRADAAAEPVAVRVENEAKPTPKPPEQVNECLDEATTPSTAVEPQVIAESAPAVHVETPASPRLEAPVSSSAAGIVIPPKTAPPPREPAVPKTPATPPASKSAVQPGHNTAHAIETPKHQLPAPKPREETKSAAPKTPPVASPSSQASAPKAEPPKTQPPVAFQAAWEVDKVNWPEECDTLARGDAFGPLAKSLLDAARCGKKVIAVTGVGRGEGRTTLALCVARRAAKNGARVAILDADFERPDLGRRIGIDMESGWDDVLTDGQPLSEAAVASLEDNLTVIPLGRRAAALVSAHTVTALQQAAEAFDLVLVDMGPVTADEPSEPTGEAPSPVAALVVFDRRNATEDDIAQALDRLQAAGIETLGVIETFA